MYVYLILTECGFLISGIDWSYGKGLDNCMVVLAWYQYFWYWIAMWILWLYIGRLTMVCFCVLDKLLRTMGMRLGFDTSFSNG